MSKRYNGKPEPFGCRVPKPGRPKDGMCRYPGCGRKLSEYNRYDQCHFHAVRDPGENQAWEPTGGVSDTIYT